MSDVGFWVAVMTWGMCICAGGATTLWLASLFGLWE